MKAFKSKYGKTRTGFMATGSKGYPASEKKTQTLLDLDKIEGIVILNFQVQFGPSLNLKQGECVYL